MKEKLHKLLSKKRDLSQNEKHAKMDVVKEMRNAASELMGDKMDGLKKVSVMSNSPEGLKHGLEKAKQVVSGQHEEHMLHDAEAPYSDYKHAMEEHDGEDKSDSLGDEPGYSEGGEIQNPPDQGDYHSVDDESSNDNTEELSPDQGDYEAVNEGSPSEDGEPSEEEEESEDEEFSGLDMDQLDQKLQKLMKMREKMGR